MRVFFQRAVGESAIPHQTDEQTEQIDAILADIWSRNVLLLSRKAIWSKISIAIIVKVALAAFNLPKILAMRLPELSISAFVAFLLKEWIPLSTSFLLALIALIKDDLISSLRNILFDIGDFLFLGGLTRRVASQHQRLGPTRRLPKGHDLLTHAFSSCVLTTGDTGAAELTAAGEFLSSRNKNWEDKNKMIANYWGDGRNNPTYWQSA